MKVLDGKNERVIAHHTRSVDGWSTSDENGVAEGTFAPQKVTRCQYVIAAREVVCLEPSDERFDVALSLSRRNLLHQVRRST